MSGAAPLSGETAGNIWPRQKALDPRELFVKGIDLSGSIVGPKKRSPSLSGIRGSLGSDGPCLAFSRKPVQRLLLHVLQRPLHL